jgi:hypothetical protein
MRLDCIWAGMALRTVAAPGHTAHHLHVPCANQQLMCTFPHIMCVKTLVPLNNKSVYVFSSYLRQNTWKEQLANDVDCEIHIKAVSKPFGQHADFLYIQQVVL